MGGIGEVMIYASLCTVLHHVAGQAINPVPSDVTGQLGTDVMMECGYTGTVQFEWVEFITESVPTTIFITPQQQPENSKYEIEDTYNLIVKNLALTDGGKYGCRSLDLQSHHTANLVVLEEPTLLMPDLVEGKHVQITCSADYGGPTSPETGHTPSLRVSIDEQPMSVILDHTAPVPGQPGDYELGHLNAMLNYTGSIVDNEKNLTCEMYTESPPVSLVRTHTMDVRYPVRDINIMPQREEYHISEQLNCTAEGNPDPTFSWTAELSPGPVPVSGPILTIQSNMVGMNEWTCQATNSVEGTEIVQMTVSFEVLNSSPPGSIASALDVHRSLLLLVSFTALQIT